MEERLKNIFKIMYENNSTSNYLVFQADSNVSLLDYQTNMLLNNRVSGLLEFNINYMGKDMNCFYNVTSKCTLAGFLARKKFSRNEFLITLLNVVNNMCNLKNYLLYDSCLLLDEKFIYVEPENVEMYFVYLPFPGANNDIKGFFQKLLAELVKFKEEESDNYLQKILEAIKDELFNLTNLKLLLESLLGEDIKSNRFGKTDFEKEERPLPEKVISGKQVAGKLKEKPEIIKGNVRIPELPLSLKNKTKSNNEMLPEKPGKNIDLKNPDKTGFKIKIDKYLLILLIQPVFLIIFFLSAGSSFIKSSGDPKISIVILLGVFISLDVLVSRIIKQKDTAATKADSPGALQFIINKMQGNKPPSKAETAFQEDKRDIPDFSQVNTFRGETVVIKRNKAKGFPCLKEKDGDEIIELDKKSLIVGRMESFVDYVLKSSTIGKIHAELTKEDGEIYIMDCNSRNGTFINDNRIIPNTRQKVANKDVIRFANMEYVFYSSGTAAEV